MHLSLKVIALNVGCAILLFACNDQAVDNQKPKADSLTFIRQSNYDSLNKVMKDSVECWFRGAGFDKETAIVKTYFFSDSQTPDTFIMTFPAGKIADMQAKFSIRSHNGNILYQKSFAASWFFSNMLEVLLEVPPDNEESQRWRKKTAAYFEQKLLGDADTLMAQLQQNKKVDIWAYAEEGNEIVDSSLAAIAIQDTTTKWIYLVGLGQYEGGCYMVYDRRVDSAKEVGCND